MRGFREDLDWYYGIGTAMFMRSTMNSLLERQKIRAISAEHDHEDAWKTWPYMHVQGEKARTPGYEPDLQSLHRFGKVSKILYRLEQRSPIHESVLHAFHGDKGSRWASTTSGRLVAVYPMTTSGAKWLDGMKEKSDVHFNLIRDDERLVNELELQKSSPNDMRAARFKRIDKEALKMLADAYAMCTEIMHECANQNS